MRLANKTALITGGNSGIGLATAKLFVAEGAKVVITGRNQATLDAAARELGPNALALAADATDIAATEAAIRKGAEKFGKYDILFANAGIPGATPLGGATLETFEKVISTNLTGVFFTVQSALPHLNDNASIILNGSVISVLGIPAIRPTARRKPACARWRGSWRRNCRRAVSASTWSRPARSAPRSGALRSQRRRPKRPSRSGSRIDAARPHRRTRPYLEDGPVPGLGRCRACAGPGIVRRRRRHGVSERCADLSGVRRPPSLSGRRLKLSLNALRSALRRIGAEPEGALNAAVAARTFGA